MNPRIVFSISVKNKAEKAFKRKLTRVFISRCVCVCVCVCVFVCVVTNSVKNKAKKAFKKESFQEKAHLSFHSKVCVCVCVCVCAVTNVYYSCFCLVTKSCPTLRSHGLQHDRLLCSPLSSVCSNSCPLSQPCYLTSAFSATSFPFALNLSQN